MNASRQIEQILLQYEYDFFSCKFCNCIANLENRIAEEFIECGISGIHTRQDVIQSLHEITTDRKINISDFYVEVLSGDAVLARYKAFFEDTDRNSSHSSVWVKKDSDWKIFYHQATIHKQT